METNRIQEWFDTMYRGLAAQSWKRAVGANGGCAYRIGNLKCAVGHIIPDNAGCILPNIVVASMRKNNTLHLLSLGTISPSELHFLIEAQASHDEERNGNTYNLILSSVHKPTLADGDKDSNHERLNSNARSRYAGKRVSETKESQSGRIAQ